MVFYLPADYHDSIIKDLADGLIFNKSLRILDLNNVVCQDDKILKYFFDSLTKHKNIEHLKIDRTVFSNEIVSEFLEKKHPSLKKIDIFISSNNGDGKKLIENLMKFESLEELNIEYHSIFENIFIENLKHMKSIKKLKVDHVIKDLDLFIDSMENLHNLVGFVNRGIGVAEKCPSKIKSYIIRNKKRLEMENHFPLKSNLKFFDISFKF